MMIRSRFSILSSLTVALASVLVSGQGFCEPEDGTVNDLPTPILHCVETMGGAEVLDGRVEADVGRDQFGVYSLRVVQRDRFSGDNEIALFLGLTRAGGRPVEQELPSRPLILEGQAAMHAMTLYLGNVNAAEGYREAYLDLRQRTELRSIELRCDIL